MLANEIAEFDVGVVAIEVTQAIRTDIPTGTPQAGIIVLPPDGGLQSHVAERRTIVRVYPWVRDVVAGASIPPLSAELRGFVAGGGLELPGSPLTPRNPTLTVQPDTPLSGKLMLEGW